MGSGTRAGLAILRDQDNPPTVDGGRYGHRPVRADLMATLAVAGVATEHSWVLATNFEGHRFHSPRLVYCGATDQTRFEVKDLDPRIPVGSPTPARDRPGEPESQRSRSVR